MSTSNTLVTSIWWRVRVHATQEEKIFDTANEAKRWADKVAYTFGDRTMQFDIVKIIETTEIYKCKD